MSIANRPAVPDVILPVRRTAQDLPRLVETVNSNFRKQIADAYKISQALDTDLTTLAARVAALEAVPPPPTTTPSTASAIASMATSVATVLEIKDNTVSVTLSGATTTASAVVPTNSILFAIFVTITSMTGATSISAGVTNNPNMFGAGLTTSGDIDDYTFINLRYISGGALDVLLTAVGGNFTGGTADVTGHYWVRP